MIKIDFENTFEIYHISEDLSEALFKSECIDGAFVELKIQILPHIDVFLPNVQNLAFGPLQTAGEIDDSATLGHKSLGKLFSTIFLFGLAYLKKYPEKHIGIDGSDDRRAYLYHRIFLSNKKYLSEFIQLIGVDWYVKLLRDGDIERDRNGDPYFKPKPEPFDYTRPARDLYRYYIIYSN